MTLATKGKFKVKSEKLKDGRQAGVTLLLAILVLSSIMAISFSLATILFTEGRTSSDLLRTEGSWYGSSGVGEEALFTLERSVPSTSCPNANCYTAQFNNNVSLGAQPQAVATSSPSFEDRVSPAIFATTKNKYDFCGKTAGSAGCGYQKVVISFILDTGVGDTVQAYLCQWNPNEAVVTSISAGLPNSTYGHAGTYSTLPCTDTGAPYNAADNYWVYSGGISMTSSTNTTWTYTLDPTLQQRLILVNTGTGGARDVYVSISTFGSDGTTPQGLPFVGKTAVNVNVVNAAVGRKVQVVVPNH